jgi:glycosyltransferase involved in cell wall biosynthesis
MNVAFQLEDTRIGAAVRTAMALADALVARGDRVRIVTLGEPVHWRSSRAEWIYVDTFRESGASEGEVVVDAAMLRSLPQVVEDPFFRAAAPPENAPLRLLLAGSSQQESRAIPDGYGAAAHARWFHQQFELVRVSPWAPSREEPLDSVDEFHVALTTSEMTRLVHSCDVYVASGLTEDGDDLVAKEALAAGLACVFTSTPAHRAYAKEHDYAVFARENDAVELGERLIELLENFELREAVRARGREVAEQWRIEPAIRAFDAKIAR